MKHFGLCGQDVFIIFSGFPRKKNSKQERGGNILCCFQRLKSLIAKT